MQQYNVDYFIKKFEEIPEEKWIAGSFSGMNGTHCALGHCYNNGEGYTQSPEGSALIRILNYPAQINDGLRSEYQQNNPKNRILAALYDKKAELAVKEAQEIINTEQEVLV